MFQEITFSLFKGLLAVSLVAALSTTPAETVLVSVVYLLYTSFGVLEVRYLWHFFTFCTPLGVFEVRYLWPHVTQPWVKYLPVPWVKNYSYRNIGKCCRPLSGYLWPLDGYLWPLPSTCQPSRGGSNIDSPPSFWWRGRGSISKPESGQLTHGY